MNAKEEAVSYINGITKFVKKNDLSHTRRCLARLSDPDRAFDVLHIAGTNGKGSTCAFLAQALREAGVKTALFTSPHLIDINERFQIDGAVIGDETFLDAYRKVRAVSEQMVEEGEQHPSYFEFLFLMGMLIFKEAHVEAAVLETGLGGRFDATNAVEHPLLCVITSIGMDHMQYLGNTIAEIAGEKAGIIKEGIPVIYDDRAKEAAEVIAEKAAEMHAPASALSDAGSREVLIDGTGTHFTTAIDWYGPEEFVVPFTAPYQIYNASLALLALERLKDRYTLTPGGIRHALAHTVWAGRMQPVGDKILIDGAHNEDGVGQFIKAVQKLAKGEEITLLFGAMKDKDFSTMIRQIVEGVDPDRVIVTKADEYRGETAEVLAAQFREAGARCVIPVEVPEEAWKRAAELKGDGWLFGAGSLYLIGRILAIHDQLR